MKNYIPDQNRFALAGPPKWWLKLLKDFDSSLVIVPSRQGAYYRLGQRRKLRLATAVVNDVMKEQADTAMLASYGLIPVSTINPLANWSPAMFEELTARAPWRQGGADKFTKKLEEFEAEREAKKEAKLEQNLTDRSKDGWKLYQAKTGQRTFVNSAKVKSWDRPAPHKAPIPANYTATSSGLLVPRF